MPFPLQTPRPPREPELPVRVTPFPLDAWPLPFMIEVMQKKERSPADTEPTQITLTLPAHVVRDMELMARNTKRPVDELVTISLKMYIATHNDYLLRNKVP